MSRKDDGIFRLFLIKPRALGREVWPGWGGVRGRFLVTVAVQGISHS